MLPFHTLEEAELSLGRNLTLAETLWFEYSAEKSDFVLYCHNTLFLFMTYTLFPIPFVLFELMGSKKIIDDDKYKIQPKIRNSLSEMMRCYKKVMWTFVCAVCPTQIISYPVIKWGGIRTSLAVPSGAEVFWQIVVYVLIEDYTQYWIHRLIMHSEWGYEKIHKVHHEYTASHAYAGPYAHGAEIVEAGSCGFIGPLMVPCHMLTLWLWLILKECEVLETHSGYEFPWNPYKLIPFYGGAVFHDYHHSRGQGRFRSNFASVFTYCDYIYGTDKGYRYRRNAIHKMRHS